MSSRLALYLLGPPQLFLDNEPIPVERRKAVALLAYLAIERGQHGRESLSALLWPDYDQPKAFTNLRHTLWEIQQSIGEGWLITTREKIGLNKDIDVWLDVGQFESLLTQSRAENDTSLRIPLLVESTKLYRNHFMTGFSLKDAPNFNEWAFVESEDLRGQLAGALTSLSEDYCALGQAEKAIPYARRLITLDPLNESAHRRVMNVYLQAGQLSAALKQYQLCEEILRKELNIDPQPETRALYKKIRKRELNPVQVVKPSEPVSPRYNLPLQLSSFIGREKEQKEIADLIATHRLVTLTGAGGIGKSRLSIQVASALLHDFPDGIWLVEFAPLSDPMLVPQVVITTLGLIEQTGLSPVNILTDFLQGKRTLLILDNCEHLIHACAQLAETLLHACPDLHILATSREALSIAGETLYRVPSLTTPDPIHVTVDTLSNYESIQLFVERAQSTLAGFILTEKNAPAIAQVCRDLDGIPLALELAAARVKLLRVEEIAARLVDRFRLLTDGSRTALPRHQTLRAMIDWSYDLLSEPERILLRRLSAFAGGWSLEAAESVCAGEGIEMDEVLDLMTQLVNKSLIIIERQQGQETRYRMLETIRQYAHDKLWTADEGDRMRQRHLAYFVELAERAEPNLHASNMVMWLDRLETEIDNIRAALHWALESNIEAELELAGALRWFWHIRDHKSEGSEWLERALSIETMERGDQPLTPSRAIIRGKALYVAGFLRLKFYEINRAVVLSEEGLALFSELGPDGKQGMAHALLNLGEAAYRQENFRLSKALMEQSLALFQEVGDKVGMARCLPMIANVSLIVDGDYERAKTLAEEGLALSKEIGDKNIHAKTMESLGGVAYQQGDYKQATTWSEASLALFREVGNQYASGGMLSMLGKAAKAQGHYGKATTALEEALTFTRNSGNKIFIAHVHYSLGEVAAVQGDYKEATKQYEEVLAIGRQTGNPEPMADGLLGLGGVACAQGESEQAIQKFEAALVISRDAGSKSRTARALYSLGRVAQSKGDYSKAHSLYMKAIMICQEISDRFLVAFHLIALATLAAAQKQLEQAARLFGAAKTLHAGIRFELFPAERAEHDRAVVAVRTELGEEAFAIAWKEGQKMTLDEAVGYAIEGS